MTLSQFRIFFGHQSVGNNIIDGIRTENPAGQSLKIVETRHPYEQEGPCLLHAPVGQNQNPVSKISDFATLMKNGFGNNVDIACFKFCYIDINRETDVGSLFSEYQSTMTTLTSQFPRTQFMHITVPLRTVEPGFRLFVKGLMGKKSIALADNSKRQLFNEMMRTTFTNKQPIFDLARAESTYPSGKRLSNTFGGDLVFSLIPEYTDDGGHLNKKGRQIVANQFIEYLKQLQ